MDIPFHQEQIDFMMSLASSRIEFLNPLFWLLNYVDSSYFLFPLFTIILVGCSYRWGLRFFYLVSISNILNTVVKQLVEWPRPSTEFPEIGMVHFPSYGFPSGGAQNAMLFGLLLIFYWRTRAAWIIGVAWILLLSFTRLYLAVHYPIDVLGGWAIAIPLFIAFYYTIGSIEKYLAKKGLAFSLVISLALPFLLFFSNSQNIKDIGGTLLGVGLATYFSLKHHLFLSRPKSLGEAALRSLLAVALFFLLYFAIPESLYSPLRYFAILFIFTLAVSPLCRLLVKHAR